MASKERRRSVRVGMPMDIEYSAGCPPIRARVSDISVGGMFVETNYPLAPGSRIDFWFIIPKTPGQRPIKGSARVAWHDQATGEGVTFDSLSEEDVNRIRLLVSMVRRTRAAA